MAYKILVASYTSAVHTLSFDPSAQPTLTHLASTEIGTHPSWITSHPEDKNLVFAALEQPRGKVIALKYDTNDGRGKVVAEAESGGDDPCTLLASNDELIIGNYSSGLVTTLPISSRPPYILASTPSSTLQLSGTGPNTSRQESSHPHQIVLRPGFRGDDTEILVPDLGSDRTWRLIKRDGIWGLAGSVQYEAGGGPRHAVIDGTILYTILELNSTLAVHSLPSHSANSESLSVTYLPTLSNPPSPDTLPAPMLAAEILLSKSNTSFPTRYLYVSNRNDIHPEGDSIAIFSVPEGSYTPSASNVQLVAEIRTRLHHLRAIVLGGPDERYLIAGGANGGGVKVFERADAGRGLKLSAALEGDGLNPTGFLWL